MEPYLFHGIKWYNYELMIKILESGYILPRCMQKDILKDKNNIFNGTKYISLCQKTLGGYNNPDLFRSSYDEFIFENPMFVLDNKKIDVIYPNVLSMLDKDMMTTEEWHNIIFKDDSTRYTYYCDELQTKNKISLQDCLIAVGIPLDHLKLSCTNEEIANILKRIRKEITKLNLDSPIVNSSEYRCADNQECIKKYTIN